MFELAICDGNKLWPVSLRIGPVTTCVRCGRLIGRPQLDGYAGDYISRPLTVPTVDEMPQTIDDPVRKIADVRHQIGAETGKGNLRRRHNQHRAEQHQIHQVDHDQRKKCSVIAQVSLFLWNHPAGKCEMERPGGADEGVKQPAIRLQVVKKTEQRRRARSRERCRAEKSRARERSKNLSGS